MPAVLRSYAQIQDTLRSPYAVDDLAVDPPSPLLLVDVSGQNIGDESAVALRALPAVTVAISATPQATTGPGLDAFDVLLADGPVPPGVACWLEPGGGVDDAVSRIAQRVATNPQASVMAVQLLRLSAGLDVLGGLTAESMTYAALQAGSEFRRWLGAQPAASGRAVNQVALEVDRVDDELRLTFNRPEIHNAFGFEVRDALVDALRLAEADSRIRSVVLAGHGRSFCSGGDLREFGTAVDPVSAHLIRTTRSAGYWIDRVADLVRVQIHGACIGAGIELSAFAGRVSAKPDLVVALPELAMGLVPGAGGTVSLPRRIGRQRTAYLTLTGERLDAGTARTWGLVDEIC